MYIYDMICIYDAFPSAVRRQTTAGLLDRETDSMTAELPDLNVFCCSWVAWEREPTWTRVFVCTVYIEVLEDQSTKDSAGLS